MRVVHGVDVGGTETFPGSVASCVSVVSTAADIADRPPCAYAEPLQRDNHVSAKRS